MDTQAIFVLRHLDVAPYFGSTWFIPTFGVPLLLVTHALMFVRLIRRAPDTGDQAS